MVNSARRILVSEKLFQLSSVLLADLREYRNVNGTDALMATRDAFLLDPGLGPSVYLSSDGQIIWDDDGWGIQGTRREALAAIRAGAKRTGILGLQGLLPSRGDASRACPDCDATGWFDNHGQLADVHGHPFSVVCSTCAGLGWIDPSIDLTASVLAAEHDAPTPS